MGACPEAPSRRIFFRRHGPKVSYVAVLVIAVAVSVPGVADDLVISHPQSRRVTHWRWDGASNAAVPVYQSTGGGTPHSLQNTTSAASATTDALFMVLSAGVVAARETYFHSLSGSQSQLKQSRRTDHSHNTAIFSRPSVDDTELTHAMNNPKHTSPTSSRSKVVKRLLPDIDLNNLERLKVPTLLSCGPPVASTIFDHLSGVKNRAAVPQVPEKDVYSSLLPMNSAANLEILRLSDLNELLQNNADLHDRLKMKRGTNALYNALGQLYRVRGNTTVAIECFRKVLSNNPADQEALLNLCDTLFRLEKWSEAEELMHYSLSYPTHQEVDQNHFALGRALLAQGRNIDAIESFKKCLKINPNHHTAQAGLAVSRSMVSNNGDSNFYTGAIIMLCIGFTIAFVVRTLSTSSTSTELQCEDGCTTTGGIRSDHSKRPDIRMGTRPDRIKGYK